MSQQELRRARHTPMRVHSHGFIGVLVFTETHRRVLGGKFGRIPEPLSEDAFSMGGYCIDAPDTLPAGSMQFYKFGPDEDEWLADPTTVDREGE